MDRRYLLLRPPPYATDRSAAGAASTFDVSAPSPAASAPLPAASRSSSLASTHGAPPPPSSSSSPPPLGDIANSSLRPVFVDPNFTVRTSTSATPASLETPPSTMSASGFVDNAASFASLFSSRRPTPCFAYGAAASQFPLSPPALAYPSATAADSAPFPASAASAASGSTSRSRRLPLKRIEKSAQRQVALCKRRNRLFRKAHEISVLCDATVGIIIFSSSGKVSEFCSSSTSMPEIIQRYQGSNTNANSHIMLEQTIEKWKQQSIQLKDQVSYLKQRQCYIMGEGEMDCSVSDLEDIESTLQRSISKLRMRKMELMQQEIQELSTKQSILQKENQMLREKEVNIVDHVNTENPLNNASSTADSIDTTLKLGQQ